MFPPVFICGMPGSGKSTLGKKLASSLGFNFIDLDTLIEQSAGMPVKEIFKTHGEATFRKMETEALDSCLALQNTLIACGGGTPCFANNLQVMQEAGVCVYVHLPVTALAKRLKQKSAIDSRPLLSQEETDPEEQLEQLYEARKHWYQQISIVVSPLKESKDEMLQIIIEALSSAKP